MDEKIYALVQGEKGLYYTDGVRIYFPDRKWTEAKLGFFTDLHVTIEKDKYSFISGKMIETLPLSAETFFEAQPFKLSSTYFYKLLGDTMMIIEKDCNGYWSAYVNTKNGIQQVFHTEDYVLGYKRMYKEHYRRNCFTDVLFKDKQTVDTTAYIKTWYADNCKLDEDRFMEACIRLCSRADFLGRKVTDFKLYDNTFIVVTYTVSYTYSKDETYTMIFVYDNNDKLHDIRDVDVKTLGKVERKLTKDEVDNFCVEKHICLGYGHDTDISENLVMKVFSGLGAEVTIYAWCGDKFKMDFLSDENLIKVIDDDFAKLQATVKRVGKSCTGRLVNELQKFNVRPWLLHK